jgi:tRNA (guanosine-2'-O-)-methyltransferase
MSREAPSPHTEPTDPAHVIAALSPHLTPRRLARMQAVLAQRTRHLSAVLEELYDPHNVAACARTAEGLGLQDLHLVPHPPHKPTSRPARDPALTMGDLGGAPEPEAPDSAADTDLARAVSGRAERWLDLFEHRTIETAIAHLKTTGHRVVATALSADAIPLTDLPLDRPLAVVFGNERSGVSPTALALTDHHVVFPMRGFAQSFNISVAFSLIMGQLRTRLDAELPSTTWSLPPEAQTTLLARWLVSSIPHAEAILAASSSSAARGSRGR